MFSRSPHPLEGNVLGTHHVLEAARRTGVRRVVLASGNRLFPGRADGLRADTPPRPDGLYGVSKVAVETLGRLYADKFGLLTGKSCDHSRRDDVCV